MRPLRLLPGSAPVRAGVDVQGEVVLRFLAEVRLTGDTHAAERLMAASVPAHQVTTGETVVRSPGEYAEHARELVEHAGSASFEVTELLVDRDRVYVRWRLVTARGQDTGSAVYRIAHGRIAEYWIQLPA